MREYLLGGQQGCTRSVDRGLRSDKKGRVEDLKTIRADRPHGTMAHVEGSVKHAIIEGGKMTTKQAEDYIVEMYSTGRFNIESW